MFRVPAYYSENDPFAAAWLRELIKEGVIAPGDVDERDIRDVVPNELRNYTQWHLFGGVGGWSYALRLANWPDSRPVLTVSCPCQPYSSAGKGAGFADERHLWPAAFHIIHGLRDKVPTIFGEQVSSAVNHGWWDLVADDLEGIDYEVWAKDFPACSVGAFHKRQRLYFVADSRQNERRPENERGRILAGENEKERTQEAVDDKRCGKDVFVSESHEHERGQECADGRGFGEGSGTQGLEQRSVRGGDEFVAHAERSERRSCGVFGRRKANETAGSGTPAQFTGDCEAGFVADSTDLRRLERRDATCVALQGERAERSGEHEADGHAGELSRRSEGLCGVGGLERGRADDGVGDSSRSLLRGQRPGLDRVVGGWETEEQNHRQANANGASGPSETNFWSDCIWLPCRDSKLRPVERATKPSPEQISNGLFNDLGYMCDASGNYFFSPLIEKAKNRVGRLRGYGNAICPQVAAEFIRAYLASRR